MVYIRKSVCVCVCNQRDVAPAGAVVTKLRFYLRIMQATPCRAEERCVRVKGCVCGASVASSAHKGGIHQVGGAGWLEGLTGVLPDLSGDCGRAKEDGEGRVRRNGWRSMWQFVKSYLPPPPPPLNRREGRGGGCWVPITAKWSSWIRGGGVGQGERGKKGGCRSEGGSVWSRQGVSDVGGPSSPLL